MPELTRRHFLMTAAASLAAVRAGSIRAAGSQRVIVIGAGVVGASIAYHLARRGASVTILEKFQPAAGATRCSFAWLTSYLKAPRAYCELTSAGINGWRRLQLEIGSQLSIQWGGAVYWVSSEPGARKLEGEARERARFGHSMHLIGTDKISALVPGATPGPVTAAAFSDVEGGVDPVDVTHVLLSQARAMGATLISPCELLALDVRAGRIDGLRTTHGNMVADHYVLAAGVDTMALARGAGVPVPLVDAPGVLAHTKPLPPVLDRILIPLDHRACGIKQNPDGRIVTGGHFGDQGDGVLKPDAQTGQRMLARAAGYLPPLRQAELQFMTLGLGVRPADGLPVVGSHPACANLYVAAMDTGVTLAPIIGQLASIELLDGVDTEMLAPFRASRFDPH